MPALTGRVDELVRCYFLDADPVRRVGRGLRGPRRSGRSGRSRASGARRPVHSDDPRHRPLPGRALVGRRAPPAPRGLRRMLAVLALCAGEIHGRLLGDEIRPCVRGSAPPTGTMGADPQRLRELIATPGDPRPQPVDLLLQSFPALVELLDPGLGAPRASAAPASRPSSAATIIRTASARAWASIVRAQILGLRDGPIGGVLRHEQGARHGLLTQGRCRSPVESRRWRNRVPTSSAVRRRVRARRGRRPPLRGRRRHRQGCSPAASLGTQPHEGHWASSPSADATARTPLALGDRSGRSGLGRSG